SSAWVWIAGSSFSATAMISLSALTTWSFSVSKDSRTDITGLLSCFADDPVRQVRGASGSALSLCAQLRTRLTLSPNRRHDEHPAARVPGDLVRDAAPDEFAEAVP